METITDYRRKAEELRQRAMDAGDEVARSTYLAAARSWELLAESDDQRSKEVMLRALIDR
ncbi:MAG: hypothetical protein ACXWN9_13280 [Candidatus Binataceae bacterium]